MSTIKTILVHLADDDHHEVRLKVGVALAKTFQAHLRALFITFPIGMPAPIAGRGASAIFIEAAQEAALKKAKALEAEFSALCINANLSHDWIVESGAHLEALTYHAHAADLLIVSQSQPREHFEDRFRMRIAEEITMVSGIPILMLPRSWQGSDDFGKNILIAWRASREAVRAVRDSLPFLSRAQEVTALAIGKQEKVSIGEEELVDYLGRHGVVAKPRHRNKEGKTVAQALIAAATEKNADMIVMGAYGHSWIRELVLGGVTREVFAKAPIPVFLSH